MSKPWDNEKTPRCDSNTYYGFVGGGTARDMERRARHAEALLQACWTRGEMTRQRDIIAHLAAAAQENER